MKRLLFLLIIILAVTGSNFALAQTISSPNYRIENPTLDAGGEPSSSTNYRSQDSASDIEGDSSSSTNYKAFPGFEQGAYPGVPGVPTLTNTGGTLYNALDFVILTGGNAIDTNYAIAISSDNFATTFFIQTDDTVGSSPAWQTYANWGSGSGERVTGLASSTTYKIKVKARFGIDTETDYSSEASAATSSPAITMTFTGINSGTSVAGETTSVTSTTNAIAYGSLVINTPSVAAHKVTVTTNAAGGYATTIKQDGHLRTTTPGQQIDPVSGTNTTPAAWPGSVSTGAFGYHTTDALLCTGTTTRFATNNTYAQLTTSPEEVACNSAPVTAEETTLVYKVEIGSLQTPGSYQNIITYVTTGIF